MDAATNYLVLEQALLSSGDGALLLDGDFHVLFANPCAASMFLQPAAKLEAMRVWDILPGLAEASVRECVVVAREYRADYCLGGSKPVSLRITKLDEGAIVWIRPGGATERERELQSQLTAQTVQSNAIVRCMRNGLIVANGAGKIVSVNPMALHFFGAENLEAMERNLDEFTMSEPSGYVLNRQDWPLERVMRGEVLRNYEVEVQRNGGSPWLSSYDSEVVRDQSGAIQCAVMTVRDVTAQRHAEQALRESEAQRLLALDAAGLGTWFLNIDENRLVWSDRTVAMYGLPPGSQGNLDRFYKLVHEEDRSCVQKVVERVAGSPEEKLDTSFRVVWPDGSIHWVHASGRAHFASDGHAVRMEGVVVNIDERKAIDLELRRTEATLRAIIEGSPVAIVVTGAEEKVTVWNPAAERILGFARNAVIDAASPLTIEATGEIHGREYRTVRADGAEIELVCSVAPLRGDEGQVTGHLFMFSDTTERTRMRRRMEHTQKLESLGVLAGGVAHDFNNLLTGILGNASLGLYCVDETSEVRPLLEEVIRSSERAAALTRQLLAYAGKGRFNAAPLNLTELAREITRMGIASVANPRVKLRMELEENMAPVEADGSQLQQVILSLVINAAEAIGEKEAGLIHVVTRTEYVSESMIKAWETSEPLPPGGYAVLEVEDDGIGMDAATRARIFEPFFSTKFTGRGLGLSAVLGIVRQHRGALSVHTVPGMGSTFRVLLPLIEEERTVHDPRVSFKDLSGKGLVLVVDDEETVRFTVQRTLEHWKYEVVSAENGQAAVEVFPAIARDVSVIILDLTMPVMGGEEALEHFQRIRPTVPVILTSGYSEVDAMRRMRGRGVAAFLQKPFTAEQLGRKLVDTLKDVENVKAVS